MLSNMRSNDHFSKTFDSFDSILKNVGTCQIFFPPPSFSVAMFVMYFDYIIDIQTRSGAEQVAPSTEKCSEHTMEQKGFLWVGVSNEVVRPVGVFSE